MTFKPKHRPSSAVEELAADWLARREAGLTVEEQAEFSRWLLADACHADAVRQIESCWRFLQKPRFTGQADEVEQAIARRMAVDGRRRRSRLIGLALGGLAAAAALAFFFVPRETVEPTASLASLPASVAAKPERRVLADGTIVELNAGAEIETAFTPERRDVRLVRGEAHFAVTKDATRPFIVTAGTVTVRAVGTAFAVSLEPAEVGVLVTEGRVAVERQSSDAVTSPPAAPTYLGAGLRLKVPTAPSALAAVPNELSPQDMRAALAWRGMRVEFTDTPLVEAVGLFNRQNQLQLALTGDGLGDIRISGIFWADDPEGFSRLIETSVGLQVDRTSATRIVLHLPTDKHP